jgi:DNA processing protein
MQWENPLKKKAQAVQQELFPDVGEDEKMIIDTLRGADNKHINQIVIDTNLNIGRVTSALFELELKGIIQVLGGARYRLRH